MKSAVVKLVNFGSDIIILLLNCWSEIISRVDFVYQVTCFQMCFSEECPRVLVTRDNSNHGDVQPKLEEPWDSLVTKILATSCSWTLMTHLNMAKAAVKKAAQ
jgi:hypothetical protein